MSETVSSTDVRIYTMLANPFTSNVDKLYEDNASRFSESPACNRHSTDARRSSPPATPVCQEEDQVSDSAEDPPDNESSASQSNSRSSGSPRSVASRRSLQSRSRASSRTQSSESGSDGETAASLGSTSRAAPTSKFASYVRSHAATPLREQGSDVGDPKSLSDSDLMAKQNILMDMERLKLQGITLSKTWTLVDRLDDMQFEVRRHMLHMEELNNITMMRDGLRLACAGFEMLNTKLGILDVQGWSSEATSDMDKYNTALGKLYRKYWRKSYGSSPEMEIAMGLVGSVGMYHFKRKLSNHMMGPPREAPSRNYRPPANARFSPRPDTPSESDSEGLPP